MKIAICDDISEQIEIIKAAVNQYYNQRNDVAVEIETFDKAFDFLYAQEKNKFDIVLLDICMPGMLGTDIAKEIRQRRDNTEIVFLTKSDEFAVDAFQVKAAHYLLKPFTQSAFDEAMNRVMQNIDKNLTKVIYLKCTGGMVQAVDKDSITYIESEAHRQSVVLVSGETVGTVQTLTEIHKALEELSQGQFISPYKGYIVNQHAISTIENDIIILKSGKHIPIPRRNFREIKQTYFDYMFKGRN